MVFNQPIALQGAGRCSNADPAHSQLVGKKFMGDMKAVRVVTVLAHQQPACQALTDQVKTQAGGRCGLLGHADTYKYRFKLRCSAALRASSCMKGTVAMRQAAPEPCASAGSGAVTIPSTKCPSSKPSRPTMPTFTLGFPAINVTREMTPE